MHTFSLYCDGTEKVKNMTSSMGGLRNWGRNKRCNNLSSQQSLKYLSTIWIKVDYNLVNLDPVYEFMLLQECEIKHCIRRGWCVPTFNFPLIKRLQCSFCVSAITGEAISNHPPSSHRMAKLFISTL